MNWIYPQTPLSCNIQRDFDAQSLKAKLPQVTGAALELSLTLPRPPAHFPAITLTPALPTAQGIGK